VLVETAGGGARTGKQQSGQPVAGHHGLIEGVAEAAAIRDLLTAKMRASKSAGLGDEAAIERRVHAAGWTAEHVAVLREIREAAEGIAAI